MASFQIPNDIVAEVRRRNVPLADYARLVAKHGNLLTVADMKLCDDMQMPWDDYAAAYARTFGRSFGEAPNVGAEVMAEAETW
jgi:hypothetical protein